MEERYALAVDTYTWSPTNGNNASLSENWKLNNVQQGAGANVPGDVNSTDQVLLDANVSNQPITWNISPTMSKMTLQNGYTGQQTITGDNSITLTGENGTGSFGMGTNAADAFNLKFSDADEEFVVNANANFTNFSITTAAGQVGTFIIYGGTTTIAANQNYSESIDCNVILGNGGIVNDLGKCALAFGSANSNLYFRINSQSSFNLSGGTAAANTLISSTTTGNYFDVNGGTFAYTGVGAPAANQITDNIAAAILVENSGVFSVASGGGGLNTGSNLLVNGAYTDPPGGKTASVYMKGGSIQLSQLAHFSVARITIKAAVRWGRWIQVPLPSWMERPRLRVQPTSWEASSRSPKV